MREMNDGVDGRGVESGNGDVNVEVNEVMIGSAIEAEGMKGANIMVPATTTIAVEDNIDPATFQIQ